MPWSSLNSLRGWVAVTLPTRVDFVTVMAPNQPQAGAHAQALQLDEVVAQRPTCPPEQRQ